MTNISREDFLAWKDNHVTKTVMKIVENMILGLEQELGMQAGLDPLSDRFKAGAIQGFRDVLDVGIQEVVTQ